MDLKLLRTFVTVASHVHFHEAARRLFLSQPTVSKHVRQLEEALGCQLFVRAGKQVRLTPAGERFLPEARKLLESADAAFHAMAAWRQGYDGLLRLAASPMVARTFLPPVLRRYATRYPKVELTVNVAESSEIAAMVGRRDADLGLSRSPVHDPSLHVTRLYDDSIVLVAPPDGGDLESPIASWEKLLDTLPVISHNHPGYWDLLLEQLARRGISYRLMRVSQIDITLRFVEVGLGLSFLPRSAVQHAIAECRVQEVPAPDLDLPVTSTYLIAPISPSPTAAAKAFVQLLSELRIPLAYSW